MASLPLLFAGDVLGYSVLTHEQIVDIAWKDKLAPMLRERFPSTTEADLQKAHGYAYGGCLIPDIGYFPFGNKLFSDLLHYARTGDFVTALIEQSSNVNEYAFALGALAHYASDNNGHPMINRAVALSFPDLRKKYGDSVTYAENHTAHARVEFGFDLVQVAKNRYTSERYHDFIGFAISRPVLERAFQKTYGLPLGNVLKHEDLAFTTFRRGISEVVPELTKEALTWKRLDLVHETPNFDEQKFLYHLSRSDFEKEWGRGYRKPSFMARVVRFVFRWGPKVGPLKALDFVVPTRETEDLYVKSVDQTSESYRCLLDSVQTSWFHLPNLDYDTGRPAALGEYSGADDTYRSLVRKLEKTHFQQTSPALRDNIQQFYAASASHEDPRRIRKERRRVARAMHALEASCPAKPRPTNQLVRASP